jgi:hypothetical protein
MINRVTGEVSFLNGFHIVPYHAVQSSHRTRALPFKEWQWHFFGTHPSAHGKFEVEALSRDQGLIQIVFLAHQHPFYDPKTPEDADRRAAHERIISSELAGQKEFSWGEVLCRLQLASNKDWLVVAYNRGADIPLREKGDLLLLFAHENFPMATVEELTKS